MINLDHHPIDPAIRAEIQAKLTEIEQHHHVKVLFACESGSRGWGFASPDSDYDVRFIYTHPTRWHFQVNEPRDVIELPISAVLDISGWELRKTLGLLKKGNATLIEWLDSPIIYRADETFVQAMREAITKVHRAERSYYHYVHMAQKNYREHLRGETVRLKKYLYVLRPLLATLWIEQGRGIAPMKFQDLVDGLITDAALLNAITQLLEIKRAAMEAEHAKPIPAINAFIETELKRLEGVRPPTDDYIDFSVLDDLFFDMVMHIDREFTKN